jgi:hypothetical protein
MLAISPIEWKSIRLKCRHAIALPVFAVAVLLDYLGGAPIAALLWVGGRLLALLLLAMIVLGAAAILIRRK